jgi:hypothetical protein
LPVVKAMENCYNGFRSCGEQVEAPSTDVQEESV